MREEANWGDPAGTGAGRATGGVEGKTRLLGGRWDSTPWARGLEPRWSRASQESRMAFTVPD